MATSGNFLTNSMGSTYPYFDRMLFEWWETSRGISGSVGYHNISYHLKTYNGSSGYWEASNGSMNVDGAGYSWGRGNWYGGGATVLGDYSKTLYTDSNGNRSFGASASVAIYSTSINSSGSGSWGLDNIPLHAVLTALSPDSGVTFTDEGTAWVEFSNPSGTAVSAFIDSPIGRAVTVSNVGSRYNFVFNTALQQALQQGSVNSNSYSINIGILDSLGGPDHYDYRTRTGYIANDHGQANPLFSNFTFADTNSTTAALTGNNQIIIQTESSLSVTVPVANKATPQKFATMDHYTVTADSFSGDVAYSSSSNATISVGPIYHATGNQTISVAAVDSRSNSTLVSKPVTVIPYAPPIVTSTAIRANGYDDALVLTLSGSVSPIVVSSVEKNRINATSGAQYRFIADGGDITGVGWTNIPNGQTSGGVVTGNSTVTIAASGVTSATHPYQIQVRIIDGLYTTTQTIFVPTGTPIFRIGTDKKLYNNESEIVSAANQSRIAVANQTKALYTDVFVASGWGAYDGSAASSPSDIPTATTNLYRYGRAVKDVSNIVHLSGLMKNTTGSTKSAGTLIFTLPVGYRPGHRMVFPALANDVSARVDIDVDGTVGLYGSTGVPAGGYLTLNGISFLAEQ